MTYNPETVVRNWRNATSGENRKERLENINMEIIRNDCQQTKSASRCPQIFSVWSPSSTAFCARLQTTAQLLVSNHVPVMNHDKYRFQFPPEIWNEEVLSVWFLMKCLRVLNNPQALMSGKFRIFPLLSVSNKGASLVNHVFSFLNKGILYIHNWQRCLDRHHRIYLSQ